MRSLGPRGTLTRMKNLLIAVLSLALVAMTVAWLRQRPEPPRAVPVVDAAAPARVDVDPARARDGVSRGELVPLERLLADAESRHP